MVNRLKNALWLIVGAVVAVWALSTLVDVVRGGPMEPPAAPGPTNRMAIYQPGAGDFPIVIDQPGSYYLGENINGEAGKDGIHIRADNVTLDLNGFTLKGAEGKSSYNGITVPLDPTGVVYNLSIFNGTIRDWGAAGIGASDPNGEAYNAHLADLSLMNNGGPGVRVGSASTITRVTALGNGQDGIEADEGTVVVDSQARSNEGAGVRLDNDALVTGVVSLWNGADGINVTGGQVFDSVANGNDRDGIGLWVGEVRGCTASFNYGDGIQVKMISVVAGNVAAENGHDMGSPGHGINVTDAGNRIEGNIVSGNGSDVECANCDGIHVANGGNRIEANDMWNNYGDSINSLVGLGGNLIIKNSADSAYVTHDTDTVGQIIVGGAGAFNSDQPWANFIY